MEYIIKLILVVLLVCTSCDVKKQEINANISNVTPEFKPFVSYEEANERASLLLEKFTLAQKLDFIKGYANFFIRPVSELDIPLVYLTDASQGIHIRAAGDSYVNLDSIFKQPSKTTAFPPTIQLAATFNNKLAHSYAEAIGEECRAFGIHVLLGPGLNIYRNSQCGRNFEYLGEDPFLVSQMVENYVVGVQNTGTMATIKHLIGNQAEYYRKKSNSIISERALNEIYLPGFKAGVDAGAQAVMTAYNLVNGELAGQNKWLITDVLRNQLGYKGMVMTDWGSVNNAEKIVNSGQNIEMPLGQQLSKVNNLIEKGVLEEKQVDSMIFPILRSCIVMGFYDRDQKEKKFLDDVYFKKHSEVALQTAREGIVLLKNKSALPVKHKEPILLTGKFVKVLAKGLGSGEVEGYDNIHLFTALKNEFGSQIRAIENPTDEEILKASQVFLSIGMSDGEGFDRPFELKYEEETYIQRVLELNKNVVVIVNSGSAFKMTNWAHKAASIVWAWYPGQIGNVALAEVLSGKTNPSGKLPMSIEKNFKDSPAFNYLPKGTPKLGYEKVHWKNKKPLKEKKYDVNYEEGIFVGYRWYDMKNIEPLFPFGYGLSYTNFSFSDLQIDHGSGKIRVSFVVKNTGDVDGSEVAQLYVKDVKSSVPRPLKELKGYTRVNLKSGEQKKVQIELDEMAFSFWHPSLKKWIKEKGEFEILIGNSSRDIKLTKQINY